MNAKRWALFGGAGCASVAALTLAAFVVVGVLARRALAPEKVRPVVEEKLSRALGRPVTVGGLSVTLLPAPGASARDIRVGGGKDDAPSLAIRQVRVIPSLASLFTGQVVVDRVDLVGLDLCVRRDRAGRWLLPFSPGGGGKKPAEPDSGPSPVVRDVRLREGTFRLVDDAMRSASGSHEVARVTAIEGRLASSGGRATIEELKGMLGRTRVSGSAEFDSDCAVLRFATGSLDNRDLASLMAILGMAPIEGLSVEGKVPLEVALAVPSGPKPLSATGRASAERLRLGTLTLEGLQAPFRLERGVVTLDPLTFTAYKGREKGSVALNLNRTPTAYTIRTTLEGLDVNAALSANTGAKDFLYGTGRASGGVRGAGFEPGVLRRNLAGQAEVDVKDGVIRNFPLLARINQALRITGGDERDTRFQSLTGHFDIGGGRAHTEDLRLNAGEMAILCKGDVNLDLTLGLRGTATFTPAKSREMVHSLAELSRLQNDRGELEVPLTVSGPIGSPSISVDLAGVLKKGAETELKERLKDKLKGLFGK